MKKAGVSLVTVLLFMLVATIAATATYKWLTSEGRSSGSRLQRQTAYQSSIAGIENARSWMTYHANDVGALIKAYIDGGNKPVNIDSRLRTLQRPGQNYHVWLTGVNTENSTYKLKILSSGEAAGGAKHSEIAIFNVDGLYRVNVPVLAHHANLPFDFNYFGGSTQAQGAMGAKSMLINGNLNAANPIYTTDNLIVTGNVTMTGSSIGAAGTACIGGNLDANNGVYGGNFYVEGNASHFTWPTCPEGKKFYEDPTIDGVSCPPTERENLTGDVYINGDLDYGPQHQNFPGNLTLNGTWETHLGGYEASVAGNLCVGENGVVLINSAGRTFSVNGNVWMPGNINIWYGEKLCVCDKYWNEWNNHSLAESNVACPNNLNEYPYRYVKKSCSGFSTGSENHTSYEKIVLGQEKTSEVYIKTGQPSSEYKKHRENTKGVTRKNHIRNCKTEPCADAANHEAWTSKEGDVLIFPYIDRDEKPSKYYLFNLNGTNDVEYGSYYSNTWKTNIYSFFVDFTTKNSGTTFTNSDHSNETGHPIYVDHGYYRFLNHNGTKITGTPYCKKLADPKKFTPECGVSPWFKSNGKLHNGTLPAVEDRGFECAESVRTDCLEMLGEETEGCDGAKYKVNDLLKTAYSSFEGYANKGCAEVTTWSSDMTTKLNSCYEKNKGTSNLYHGYQVVKVTSSQMASPKDPPLHGKFIIIVTNKIGQQALPPTDQGSYVFLYLSSGGNNTLQPACNADQRGKGECSGDLYNYFIYTTQNIASGTGADAGVLFNSEVFSGSVYAQASTCANVQNFKARKMDFNQPLFQDLLDSSVICPNDNNPCGGAASSSSSAVESSASEEAPGGLDSYYISMAPQLGVTIESQYENNEPDPSTGSQTALSPSFIILPRVIYLPDDPYGYLHDYYNVLPLNGSTISKNDLTSVTCSPALNTASKLYDGTALVHEIYKCTAKANEHPDVVFWVQVGDSKRGDPTVSFVETSQEMAATDAKEVHVQISPHAEPITITTRCPPKPEGWDYAPNSGTIAENTCTFEIPANTELEVRKLFDVTTEDAANGTLSFVLFPGEGYLLGNTYAGLHVSSTATLQRTEATAAEIQEYCSAHSSECPADAGSWPKMGCDNIEVAWVRPTGNFGNITINNTWSIPVGGTGSVTLEAVPVEGCVAIIPTTDNSYDRSTLEADHTPAYTLRASVFAQKKTLRVGFEGDPGTGKNPQIVVTVGSRGNRNCYYEDASGSPRYCEIDVFSGESVTLTVVDNSESANFNYWQCASDNCPDREPLSNKNYGTFIISDDYDYLAHFGENDKHCFFDEFKDGSVPNRTNRAHIECLDGSTEYCIDYCGGTCPTASTEQNVKWRLLRGNISDISYSQYYGHVSAKGSVNKGKKDSSRDGIVVMSTVNAGLEGTMKALIQLPKASAHGSGSKAIRNSGFILRSNATATQYLMLNFYVNGSGNLEAQLCKYNEGEYSDCVSKQLYDGSSAASVDVSSMVMVSAELNENLLNVSAFTGNYYGSSPTQYSNWFNIFGSEYGDRAHEYVGFSLADQNFKIHGIGWKSEDYASECHDTYPVVKCSFAAVAKGGIVETGKDIKPWVGHSGWFDRASWSCTEEFYYYNGSDAGCGTAGNNGLTCNPYRFDKDQAGAHGYRSDGKDIKTAKAWLSCSSSDPEATPWMATSEAERAHCGYFWTGEYSECANNADLVSDAYTIGGGANQSVPFASVANLRKATLNISLENNDANELEIWLYSENDGQGCWGNCDPFESQSVKVSTASPSFDVSRDFVGDSSGFNPEKVKGIVIANHGNSYVTLKSVSSACENALSITGCSASFSGQLWTISATVKGKTEKIEEISYTAEARDDASSTTGTQQFNETNDCQNGECVGETTDGTPPVTTFTFTKEDNPLKTNQGKYYAFSINVVGNGGRSNQTYSSCSVTPSPIGSLSASCELIGAKEGPTMEQGRGLPQFKATFSGECPTGGCSYQMTMDGTEFASGKSSTHVQHTPTGNTETAAPYAFAVGSEHTYRLISTDANHPFTPATTCEQTFKITEKELNPVGVNCDNISILNPQVSSTRTIDASQVTVTNCETGCRYSISEGDVEKGSGTYAANQNYQFTSAGTAGTHTYTLKIERTSDSKKASCTFSETYQLDVTCDISAVGSEENPHDPAVAVSVSPTTVKGCGSACSYSIEGGVSPTSASGSSYDGGNVSFKDVTAKNKQSYTLTIAHTGANNVSCPFDVYYTPESSSSVEESSSSVAPSSSAGGCKCTCSDCNTVVVGTDVGVSQTSNDAMVCVFGTRITNVNVNNRKVIINGTDATSYCLNWNSGDNPCATAYSSIAKLDGGYYMEIPAGGWINATVSGATVNPCAGGGGTSSSPVASSSSVAPASSGSVTSYCSVEPTFIHSDCSKNSYGTGNFNTTGKLCIKINGNVGGFNCSECAGRSWKINGGSSTTNTSAITATADGYSYVEVSGGTNSWASMAFYNISCP